MTDKQETIIEVLNKILKAVAKGIQDGDIDELPLHSLYLFYPEEPDDPDVKLKLAVNYWRRDSDKGRADDGAERLARRILWSAGISVSSEDDGSDIDGDGYIGKEYNARFWD